MKMPLKIFIYILIFYFNVSVVYASEINDVSNKFEIFNYNSEYNDRYLRINKEGIKVYVFNREKSDFKTFKAITFIKSSLDTILAVMLDNESCSLWVHNCKKSYLLNKVSFNERYHYQILSIPFPFTNREFIFHSQMKIDHLNKSVTISMSSEPNYCADKYFELCNEINQSTLVRVNKSTASFKLKPSIKGVKITWLQHTDPTGNLPSWLVNNIVEEIPFLSFQNLKKIVKDKQYKYAKLTYDSNGNIISLINNFESKNKGSKMVNHFPIFPSF